MALGRIIKQARHLNHLRKLVSWSTLEEAVKNRLNMEIYDSPPTGKILVLAPHPGDDIFGAGGTLAKHGDQGDEIRIIYLCDGRSGTKRATTEIVREELKKTRRTEAIEATEVLGIKSNALTFWGYRDGQLSANKTTIKALTQVLSDYVPNIIYVPHPNDGEADHVATAQILAKTLSAVGSDLPAEIWSYEVSQPAFLNRLIDISATAIQKERAIEAHASQLKRRPYSQAILGLNYYRGGLAGLPGPAEGFLVMKPKLYLNLWDLLHDLND